MGLILGARGLHTYQRYHITPLPSSALLSVSDGVDNPNFWASWEAFLVNEVLDQTRKQMTIPSEFYMMNTPYRVKH